MVDTVLEGSTFPVNSIGEIITKKGSGSPAIAAQQHHASLPTALSGELLLVASRPDGAWAFMQDGRYTTSSRLTITSGTKTKITFDLTQLAFTDSSGGLVINYDQASNSFIPDTVGDSYLVNFRAKITPLANNGSVDIAAESASYGFNPVVSETRTFNKNSGIEHFISVVQPIFISSYLVNKQVSLYITPIISSIELYDYSIFIQRTYGSP